MNKISVVINTLNEEKNLPSAIKSVKGLADEIVVVDQKSTDSTRTIARKLGARVFEFKPTGYVEPARNFAISKARGDWVFVLDADERVPEKLSRKLRAIVKDPDADYYRLPRKNIVFGKWIKHSRWWPDYNIRFFKKGKVSWNEIIHSVPTTVGKGMDLEPRERNALIHNHYRNIDQYLSRSIRYSTYQAQGLVEEGYKFSWHDLIAKPIAEFLSRYFQGEGYKDSIHGLALAGLQALTEFVIYLKVWEIEKYKETNIDMNDMVSEIRKSQRDVNYWSADLKIKSGSGIFQKIRRKLKI